MGTVLPSTPWQWGTLACTSALQVIQLAVFSTHGPWRSEHQVRASHNTHTTHTHNTHAQHTHTTHTQHTHNTHALHTHTTHTHNTHTQHTHTKHNTHAQHTHTTHTHTINDKSSEFPCQALDLTQYMSCINYYHSVDQQPTPSNYNGQPRVCMCQKEKSSSIGCSSEA